jgi:hypothetical protein
MRKQRLRVIAFPAVLTLFLIYLFSRPASIPPPSLSLRTATSLPRLTSAQEQKLDEYAEATVRYFTSHQANNIRVGFAHSFFGTGKFRICRDLLCQEADEEISRGYGSPVNINEVTLRFLSLAAAYKMDWLDYLPPQERYSESWGQILTGLQTLRTMQTSGDLNQFYDGHFHRLYLTTKSEGAQSDLDRGRFEIVRPETVNIQSSDDNALPYINLLVLEGLTRDSTVDIPDRAQILKLSYEIRNAINLNGFIVGNGIVHNYDNGIPSPVVWDRISAEGYIILTALLLSNQISEEQFCQIAASSLSNYPTAWNTLHGSTIRIDQPSYHSAMFIHGVRAIHGLPVTDEEFPGIDYFVTSTKPVLEAHLEFAEYYGYEALGSQVMTQQLDGIHLFEMGGKQVQFPGNENNAMPVPGKSLSRATGSHAWFIPLARWHYLDQQDIDIIFNWMADYEAEFFHSGSDTQLGWEATIPWKPNDTTYAWKASDGGWRYTDWGRPYEALNTAYIVLSIFDALNPDAPLSSYNPEAERVKQAVSNLENPKSTCLR